MTQPPRRLRPRRFGAFVTTALLATALVGCSSGTGDAGEPGAAPDDTSETLAPTPSASATTSPSPPPYLPVPAGVKLTEQGTVLPVGDKAVVAFRPRQDRVAVLAMRVERLEKTSFEKSFKGWKLTAEDKASTPYFVRATITNEGETDLGGRPVPLYIVDGNNVLIEASSFATEFKPCPGSNFPKKFAEGDKVKVCLVYLTPEEGELTAVSFRPTQEFVPITWTGKVLGPEKFGGKQGGDDKGKGKARTKQ